MLVTGIGALCFGLLIGWITYRTLRLMKEAVKLSNIATIIIAVGGAAITALFSNGVYFGWYAIGLAIGFFGYLIFNLFLAAISSRAQKQHWSHKIYRWDHPGGMASPLWSG